MDPASVNFADVDAADTIDADVWETLVREGNVAVGPDQAPASAVPSSVPPLLESSPPIPAPSVTPHSGDATDSQNELTVVSFPHGHPGAPIPGALQCSSDHQSCDVPHTSIWAPFYSQCDWEVALWAKTRGPSSTALTELLQFPEVRPLTSAELVH
jgi:hypothetical protein